MRRSNRTASSPIEALEARVLLAGQIYITNVPNGSQSASVGEFDIAGASSNPALVPTGGTEYQYVAVYGSYLIVSNFYAGTISEYTTSGAVVNASLVTGISPFEIILSGSQLFVADGGTGVIREYTLGATPGTITSSNPALVTGLSDPDSIAISGSDMFVTDYNTGILGEYTTSGATVNASLITGLNGPEAVVVSGSDLFVSSDNASDIGEYTTSGGTVNADFISIPGPNGMAIAGSDLYVAQVNSIGEYTLTGATVNPSVIGGLSATLSVAVTGVADSPSQLAFAQPVTGTTTGGTLAPVVVDVEDASGNIVTTDSSTVSLSIDSGSGNLSGTLTVAAINGVATFSDLSIDAAGSFTLSATDGVFAPATSTNFSITTAGPVKTIGGLDPSFGTDGLASHDVGFASTDGVAADGNQSVIIGTIGNSPAESFGLTRYNADGSLDMTFGTAGVVSTSFESTDDVPTAVEVLSNGSILVAGTATTFSAGVASGSEFAVAKYNADGSMDTSFGGGSGEVLVSFSTTAGALSSDLLHAMTVAANGTIYLGGSSDAAGSGNSDFAIASLTAVGGINTVFSVDGRALLDFAGGDDQINSLAVQSNGEVVAAGSATVGGVAEIALARFLSNGAVDAHFGTKGLVTGKVGGVYDSASSVVIQPKGGAIIIGGLTASGAIGSLSSDFVVQRYTAAGKLDRTFGGTGTVTTNFGQPSAITQVILQSDGSILASGKTTANLNSVTPNMLDVALARYTTKGTLDSRFNGTGKNIIDLSAGVVSTDAVISTAQVVATETFSITPFDASSLGEEFNAFNSSEQGVVAITPGGEILDAGNSSTSTVEAELIAAGVDLLAKLLSALPVSVLGGAKATASISITESGTSPAVGTVTVQIQFATDAAGDGAITVKSLPATEKISLKQSQAKPYKFQFNYPSNLASGNYFLVVNVVNGPTLSDLNENNNTAASPTAVTIAPPTIVLAGSSLAATSTFIPGKPVSISFDLINNGNVQANGKIGLDLFLSSDQTPADGTQIIALSVPVSLLPNKLHPYKLKFTLPSTVATGTFNLLGIIDPANSLRGGDHTNGSSMSDPAPVTVG